MERKQCPYDCHLPVALKNTRGEKRTGILHTPTVLKSQLPGLLGLNALKRNRAVLDINTNKLYFLGPGDYDLDKAMPPGTDVIQCETSPSGHIILPCCEYDAPSSVVPRPDITLVARSTSLTEVAQTSSNTQVKDVPGENRSGVAQHEATIRSRSQTGSTRTAITPSSPLTRPPSTKPKQVRYSSPDVPPPPQHEPRV